MDDSAGKPLPLVYGTARIEGNVLIPDPPKLTPDSDAIVETWFVETFHNIGLDAPAFNRFRSAADDLKRRLAKKE